MTRFKFSFATAALLSALLVSSAFAGQEAATRTVKVADGTPVRLALDETLNSATAQTGDAVHLEVAGKHGIDVVTVGVRPAVHVRLAQDEVRAAEGRKPDYMIQLQGLDETAIKTFWKQGLQNGKYQGFTYNCATTVAQALKEGGGDRDAGRTTNHAVWMPAEVLRYALDIRNHLAHRSVAPQPAVR